jgi:8-oxo-dGTP pyrophosphatase MutT (NUDIX family)
MTDLHFVQMRILRELLFHPNSRFSDLNLSGLSSDHFSYHIRTLLKEGLVAKNKERYSLTSKGKTFASGIDTDSARLEKLPKVGVLVVTEKISKGKKYLAVQTRKKEPYYDYSGFITGKVRYGEKIFETAARELKEEMGLSAKFKLCFVLHEMVYDKQGNQLEDKFFHIIKAYSPKGKLKETTEEGVNRWVALTDFKKLKPIYHSELQILGWYLKDDRDFKEKKYVIEQF